MKKLWLRIGWPVVRSIWLLLRFIWLRIIMAIVKIYKWLHSTVLRRLSGMTFIICAVLFVIIQLIHGPIRDLLQLFLKITLIVFCILLLIWIWRRERFWKYTGQYCGILAAMIFATGAALFAMIKPGQNLLEVEVPAPISIIKNPKMLLDFFTTREPDWGQLVFNASFIVFCILLLIWVFASIYSWKEKKEKQSYAERMEAHLKDIKSILADIEKHLHQ